MKNGITALIALFLFTPQLQAEELFYCSSEKALNCVGITKQQCVTATDKAIELCSDKYKIEEATGSNLNNIVNCSWKQFLLISSITKSELNTCEPLFLSALEHEIARLKPKPNK